MGVNANRVLCLRAAFRFHLMRRLPIGLAALVLVLAAPGGAASRPAGTGTIVVKDVADPPSPGVNWTYSGAGPLFKLGATATTRAVASIAAGTHRLVETTPAGSAPTLAALTCVDPTHDTKTDLTEATAVVALAAGETVTCTFTHRALGPRPSAAAAATAEQFAPVLHLSAAEHYRPLAMQDYVAQASLRSGAPPRGGLAQSAPTLFSLPTGTGASYLDVRGAEPYSGAPRYRSIEQQLEQRHPRPTVYWRIARQPSTGTIAIEYWFLYLYNDFVDKHEADWEGVTVFVKDGSPIGTAYSQHQGRSWSAWPAAAPDDHPVVYVAAGSHANYPLPGSYRVKVCYTISIRRCITTSQRDNARGDGTTLTSSDYDLVQLGGTGFSGSWGSGNYVLGFGLTRDRIVDPRRRSDFSNPFAAVPPAH
jgi:hypothetical protein